MDMWAGLLLVGLWLLTALKHGYLYLPAHELKRRAARGNVVLHKLAPTAAYQPALVFLFNTLIYIDALGLVIYSSRQFSTITVVLLISATLLSTHYFAHKNFAQVVRFCAWFTPYLLKFLIKFNPIYLKLARFKPARPVTTDIYERDDLKRLLTAQKMAINNRISAVDLEAMMHVLEFEHRKIATVMVRYKDIKFVNAKEPIGPILLSELHKSGFLNFPVLGNSKHEIMGILSLKKITGYAEGGMVTDAMDEDVMYVRDNQSLEQVLQAFTKTGKHLFMVIDTREKVVGLVTIRDVLEEIIGHSIHGDFDDYHDVSSVAHH